MGMTLETYVTKNFQKISGKRWELYVITRVLHKLDDPDIEFICQQYINPPDKKGYYLADLAFPSLRLYLEIDEQQHDGESHRKADIDREAEILEVTEWECKRIEVFINTGHKTVDKPLAELNHEIDRFVEYLRIKKQQLIEKGSEISWDYEKKFLPASYMEKKIIHVEDNVALLSHKDVLRLFGYEKGHYQRAVWNIKNTNEMVWFPKLYPNNQWVNSFDDESGLILQYRKDKQPISMPTEFDPDRIVFAHQKNIFGQTVYKFFGVFRADLSMTGPIYHYFRRVKETLDLSVY